MTRTETSVTTVHESPKEPPLNLKTLKSVQWIQSVGWVKQTCGVGVEMSNATVRRVPMLNWIIASIEMVLISLLLFVQRLPWPGWMLRIIVWIDHLIESFLESFCDTVEWWWDNLTVRLMWLRDSLESFVDTVLSLCLFVVYKVFELANWAAACVVHVLKIVFAPLLWLIKAIMPPAAQKKSGPALHAIPSEDECASPASNVVLRPKSLVKTDAAGLDDIGRLSGTTSDYESDVSVMSESWSVGHTDKFGLSYNRVQMKGSAEGRLRAAMYTRVKGQLRLMRKNSINFSRGMTFYARLVLEPKVVPVAAAFLAFVRSGLAKLGLIKVFDWIAEWVQSSYLASVLVAFVISVAKVPLNILKKAVWSSKRKSRRSRSMRSESLRRRPCQTSSVTPPLLEPIGLIKSKEPVFIEDFEFCNLRKSRRRSLKEEGDMRDSALASSMDDLYHTSDSNDCSNYPRNQIIHEEEENTKELINTNEMATCNILSESLTQLENTGAEMKYNGNSIDTQDNETFPAVKAASIKLTKMYISPSGASVKPEKGIIGPTSRRESKSSSSSNKVQENSQEEPSAEQGQTEEVPASMEQNNKFCKSPKRKISFNLDYY